MQNQEMFNFTEGQNEFKELRNEIKRNTNYLKSENEPTDNTTQAARNIKLAVLCRMRLYTLNTATWNFKTSHAKPRDRHRERLTKQKVNENYNSNGMKITRETKETKIAPTKKKRRKKW